MTDLNPLPRLIANFERRVFYLSVVRCRFFGAVFLGAAIRLFANCYGAFSNPDIVGALVRDRASGLRKRRDRWFSAKEQDVRRHLRPCVWRGIVDPFCQWEVIDPRLTLLEDQLLKVLDERSVLALDISLALRPIGNAGPLVDAERFANVLELIVGEFTSIVTGKNLWWANCADKVLKCLDDAILCFVPEFVIADKP